jgi:anti-sigma factor RsiW
VNLRSAGRLEKHERELNAYRDAELRGLRRWWFERRLARSPELRAELAALQRLARCVQEFDSRSTDFDVWDRIALRLPALDAERADAPRASGLDWLASWSRPLAAVAVSAALASALFLGIMRDGAPSTPGIIHWLDTGGRGVMVLEDQGDATIVWLLDAPDDEASEGGSREAV